MPLIVLGVGFVLVGLVVFGLGVSSLGEAAWLDMMQATAKKHREAGAMFDRAAEVYKEAIRRFPPAGR